ncbi:HlyD family efflux transporter periplasmic adaptor subunit [Robertmurraya korlensis]|uniref:efflux RND transporter periplasmic adaptor subunit n=1 Tax=Robertmurraya korlensis TaxID=519977 RepID=UPI002042449A|nr:HlyD family efflux transporter periplasmic adaptor subunit [Robertmurraya korlensis]MCM3601896.1 HlyD family efflux transporter periplasmic adaptor subunit [Robertmurraya korlensis]
MKKWMSIGVVVILLAGGGFWLYKSNQTVATAEAQVMTSTVQRGDIEVQVSGSGTVASINSNDVAAASGGEVDEVLVSENDVVEEGTELVTFTDGSDPITAPHAGTITTLDVEAGDNLQNGQVVAHVTDYVTLQTVIGVDELDIASIKEGQVAKITASAYPDESFTGTVTKVSKEGTSTNGVSSFEVTVQFDDPKDLLIGMSTEVNITTESKQSVLYVPIEAVKINGNEKYVMIQESATSEDEEAVTTQQVVETGINDDQNIEIVSGLEEGQIIQLAITLSSSSDSATDRGAMRDFSGTGGASGFPSGSGMGTPPTDRVGRGGE